MRICIPVRSDEGLDSHLFPHFGSAPSFAIVETATEACEVVVNENQAHRHGHCVPATMLLARGIDTIICRGLGQRAYLNLTDAGVTVYVSRAHTVREALKGLESGALTGPIVDGLCEGHH
jgi:predicted Fe-Mo cluster-binding NifX family protein